MKHFWIILFLSPVFFWSCSGPITLESEKHNIIVNDLDWKESFDPRVALLQIPKSDLLVGRCTGFLIGRNLLMTNNHCVGDAKTAKNTKAIFGYEALSSISLSKRLYSLACHQLVATDLKLDFSILKCADSPGELFGWVTLADKSLQKGDELYVVHQNCDYFNKDNCYPTKKKSPGKVLENVPFGNNINFLHNADILQGSSGAPIFDQKTGKVIGIVNVEYRPQGYDNDGRGFMNGAIKMKSILKYLAENHPLLREELKGEERTISPKEIKVLSRYEFDGDGVIFKLKVKAKEDALPFIKMVSYHFKKGNKNLVVKSEDKDNFFSRSFKRKNPHFSGFVNIELMNGNILTKEFKFLAKNEDIYGKRKFDVNKVILLKKFKFDKALDRYVFFVKVKSDDIFSPQIKRVIYKHKNFEKTKANRKRKGFSIKLVTPYRVNPIQVIFELFNGKTYTKDIILKVHPKRKKDGKMEGLAQRVMVEKDEIYWPEFKGSLYKFKIYLESRNNLGQVKKVDYIFENKNGGENIMLTSWAEKLNFSTQVMRTPTIGWKTLGARVTLKDGRTLELKGVFIK
ncbi:serine protease [Bacteriovoracales bacterium]|nr:serine protease [Bacteriovoracales bacterium]